ncbi:MAG TPA: hypothetical protein VK463_03825 [Desulfomonilaceae bacterium]|nr:hypothetical protein [Desulfomonilaceae bacterium]
MSLRLLPSRVLINCVFAIVLVCPGTSVADEVVTTSKVIFGRVTSISSSSVAIAPGCGNTAKKIAWREIDSHFGVQFNDKFRGDRRLPGWFGTPFFSGPTAVWFRVEFSDQLRLLAEDLDLVNDELKLKLAKSHKALRGPKQAVLQITRATVPVNETEPDSFKWPESYWVVR